MTELAIAGRRFIHPDLRFMMAAHNPDDVKEDDEDQIDDLTLVKQAQAGDTRAFDELVLRYSRRLYGLIYNMTSNKDDAYDVLQEVFAKAYRSLDKFRGKSSFYTWIYAIATNMTLNFLKKRKRRISYSFDEISDESDSDPLLIDARRILDPRIQADLSTLQERLNEAMMQLSEQHRAVVTMYDIQGIPHAEISKILKVSEGTVRSRLHYAHKQLQGLLGDVWNTDE